MESKKYDYAKATRASILHMKVLHIFMGGFISYIGIRLAINEQGTGVGLFAIFFAAWLVLITCCACLVDQNMYPTIWIDDDSLTISSFPFGPIKLPWESIIAVGARRGLKDMLDSTVVQARSISLMHWLVGAAVARPLRPSFLIGQGMRDRDELIDEIKRRALTAQAKGLAK